MKEKNQKRIKTILKGFEKVQKDYDEGTLSFKQHIHERFKEDDKIVTVYKKDALERFNDEFYKTQISMFDQIIKGDVGKE